MKTCRLPRRWPEWAGAACLLDWGAARDRADLDVGGHVEKLLVPLLTELDEPPALVGYCLGGTMTIAAANLAPVDRVATIAAPWRFSDYPEDSRRVAPRPLEACAAGGRFAEGPSDGGAAGRILVARSVAHGVEVRELLQARSEQGAEARRFVVLEDWANEGEPLPLPAARELIEDFFGADLPGKGEWQIGGKAHDGRDPRATAQLHRIAGPDHAGSRALRPAGAKTSLPDMSAWWSGRRAAACMRRFAHFLDPACR